MTKSKKIVLVVAALVIVGLLIYVGVSGGALGTVQCQDCGGTGLVDGVPCDTCGSDCETCEGHGALDGALCADCHGLGRVAGDGTVPGSAWALLPPIIAIGLALITKEVYSSLAIGIVVGGLMYANFDVLKAMDAITSDGLITAVSDTAGIFIFLVELGIIVALINKAGGSRAFGTWAAKHIKTRTGAMLATFVLGVLIFIDDYFNCLTVGSVMRPVTDGHKVSRAKLAYLIDATAAPVCMIAPVSSWAAAVASYAEDGQGLKLFITAIPYNFYSLLTFVFIIAICVMGFDYGSMAMHEYNAQFKDDLYTTGERVDKELENEGVNPNGKVIDLILPVLVLIGVSVFALVYNGGILDGVSFVDAFGDTDATVGLPWAGAIALVFTIIYLMLRRIVTFKEAMEQVPKGFFAMVPPILILTFATALKNMTTLLGAKYFVAYMMNGAAASLQNFLPAIIFLVACLLAFATGTSWGTFGILIPIVLSIFPSGELQVIGISACLAGAVCGDHCSPISDTTIMSSAGAQCNHINHVSTQLPYAITVAAVSFVSFIVAGFVQTWYIALPIGIVLMIATLFVIKFITKNRRTAAKSDI
ncbi:Na+/H+ antiporter NhaC family protein [Ruminococcus sp.]|uniref:Na+/H+ antiporter NhaC family protein n=1 Tax=Ruminococcus sp. TaxID=41978 RepID=UPI003865AE95